MAGKANRMRRNPAFYRSPEGDAATKRLRTLLLEYIGADTAWAALYERFYSFFYPKDLEQEPGLLERKEPYIAELFHHSALAHFAAGCKSYTDLSKVDLAGADWKWVQIPFVTLVMRLFSSIDLISHLYDSVTENYDQGTWKKLLKSRTEKLKERCDLDARCGSCAFGRNLYYLKDRFRNQLTHGSHFYLIPRNRKAYMVNTIDGKVSVERLVELRWKAHEKLRRREEPIGTGLEGRVVNTWEHVMSEDLYPEGEPKPVDEIALELLKSGVKAVEKLNELLEGKTAKYASPTGKP